jgi:hypothetical protein
MDCTGHVPCVVLRFLAHWVAIEDSIQEIQDLREPAVCRGRRKKIQINDDESCVTNQEASVNIDHEALSSTAEKPVVKVKDGGAD